MTNGHLIKRFRAIYQSVEREVRPAGKGQQQSLSIHLGERLVTATSGRSSATNGGRILGAFLLSLIMPIAVHERHYLQQYSGQKIGGK